MLITIVLRDGLLRGRIIYKENYEDWFQTDLTIRTFLKNRLLINDYATFEKPHHYAKRMICVFVNGVQVLKMESIQEQRPEDL